MEFTEKSARAAQQTQAKDNLGNNAEDCPVCLISFNDTVYRPRTLPCGHTICTLCTDKLKEQGRVTCPECRVKHPVPEGGQFPISYALEAVIRRLRDAELTTETSQSSSTGKGKEGTRAARKKNVTGLSKKMRSFLQEQEVTVSATITACQEVQSQLNLYQTTLTDWGEQQQQLEDRLQGLVDQSRNVRELVQQEKSRAASKENEIKKGEQELRAVLEGLRTPTTEQEASVVVAEVFRCTGEVEQIMEECQESFPNTNTTASVRKVREASIAALEAVQAVQAVPEDLPTVITEEPFPQSDPEEIRPKSDKKSTIMDKLQPFLSLDFKISLQAEDLLSLTQPVRRLLEAGQVFAVHHVEGQCRYSRISFEADRLYLHTLNQQAPPIGTTALKMSEIIPPSPPCTVFLDLSWPGSAPRRIHIQLSRDTPRAREFMLLCTGQCGPTYANTNFLDMGDKGRPGEFVWGGNCKRNDGYGRLTLVSDLDEGGVYEESDQAGDVFGVHNVQGQFGIITWSREGRDECTFVFGEVVEGLHVVAEAAQHSNIVEVTVVDCGVEL